MSMIELANTILVDKKKAIDFRNIFKKIADLKGFTDKEKETSITQFYTDLNIDGRFMTMGSNLWGLKRWYTVEQRDKEIAVVPKKKKKKPVKKKAKKKEEVEEKLDIVDENIEEVVDDLNYNDGDEDDKKKNKKGKKK